MTSSRENVSLSASQHFRSVNELFPLSCSGTPAGLDRSKEILATSISSLCEYGERPQESQRKRDSSTSELKATVATLARSQEVRLIDYIALR